MSSWGVAAGTGIAELRWREASLYHLLQAYPVLQVERHKWAHHRIGQRVLHCAGRNQSGVDLRFLVVSTLAGL